MENQTKLTRGTIKLINELLNEMEPQDRNNRYKVCERLSFTLEERFVGNNFDYQVNRMGLATTGKILEKVDTYFHKYSRNFEENFKEQSSTDIVNQ